MAKGPVDPNAMKALNEMKYEIANELGITKNLLTNESGLDSGKNVFYGGYVGGHMTKKLVEMGEKELMNYNKNL
ncbi:alpha/beta-type small acid-soluble spore protein [Maledivibacter halophilus]|uniref:Small, acid-soluble spore protein, alpha/beta type n=1 Tax=Maledivibacter halophilus TaxID=36842 RepID=A0A1T5M0G7_9FIRM|nr:alpha/beta-type small acid-soluble spore protein [Maledivibacter halophilus]SKC81712.1 Small, acid-soluble spore protein, alpha/beta type [Maledivibacter halophilus]